LHREYLAALHELTREGERSVNAALDQCMSELSKIEDETSAAIRQALAECAAKERATPQTGALTEHYWDYQRKVSEVSAGARERADAARKAYLDGWKSAGDALVEMTAKVKQDYLARVQDAWRGMDIGKLDKTGVDTIVQLIDCAFVDVPAG
jgi:hypothetical protein